jgi:hypothetical protein
MASKNWTYSRSLTFKDAEGTEFNMISQLYKIGVYVIINNDPGMQYNLTPSQMVKTEKQFKKSFEAGDITDLVLGRLITVTKDKEGFYIEINT